MESNGTLSSSGAIDVAFVRSVLPFDKAERNPAVAFFGFVGSCMGSASGDVLLTPLFSSILRTEH